MRCGIRGESYWLESYRIPPSASASYAHRVSLLLDTAVARSASGRRPHVCSYWSIYLSTSH